MKHYRFESKTKSIEGDLRMTLRPRPVSVKQLPEKLDAEQERDFYRELEGSMNLERPRIVLDCSRVRAMDQRTVYLLLCCLEGAMKRNGDVRLASVKPEAQKMLEVTGAGRLFRIFDSCEEAVDSFQHRGMFATAGPAPGHAAANAA